MARPASIIGAQEGLIEIKVGQRRSRKLRRPKPMAVQAPMKTQSPFAVPSDLTPDLARVLAYWRGLLRGSAEMPFADDVNLADLPDLAGRLFLVGVFARPERFRFDLIGDDLKCDGWMGLFLDEASPVTPFEFLSAQCAAAREGAAPTYYERGDPHGYGRLLLPLWADGRNSMLLGAVQFA